MKITATTIKKVYRSKEVTIETMELKGYKFIERLFADSSGLGQENELALTPNQLERELAELVAKYGTVYTGIVSKGMFQLYIGVFTRNGKRQSQRIGNNTLRIQYTDDKYAIRLHDTDVLTFEGNKVTLDSGGWKTNTTKDRMNKYLPNHYITQKNWEWTVVNTLTGATMPFEDGMTITLQPNELEQALQATL